MASRFKGPQQPQPAQQPSRFKGPSGNAPSVYQPQEMRPRNWGSLYQGMDWLTMGGSTKAGAALDAGLNYVADTVTGGDANFSEGYNKSLDEMRLGKAIYENENPILSKAAGVGGLIVGAPAMPMIGSGLTGSLLTGATYGGVGGALEDADTLGERAWNTATGAAGGTAMGAVGHGIAKAAGPVVTGVGNAWKNWNLTPEMRAAATVAEAGDKQFGPYGAMLMNKAIHDIGPEAVPADVLGERGRALYRMGANLDPSAREAAESFAYGRRSQQNQRLANDIQGAAGVGPDRQWQSVDDMILADQKMRKPAIDQAYGEARRMGAEIPFSAYDDIMKHPVARDAFEMAVHNVAQREGVGQQGGNLAVLDEMKRILDVQGGEYGSAAGDASRLLAKVVRERTDKLIMGPEYSTARGLREDAYRSQEAFDIGAKLGGKKAPINASGIAGGVKPEHGPNMAAAYANTKVENLLNRNNTPGAMDEFTQGLGKQALESALPSEGAAKVAGAVQREQKYNRLPASLGNSSTARQQHELQSLGNETKEWGDYLPHGVNDIIFGTARRGLSALGRSFASTDKVASAPSIIKYLTGDGLLPANEKTLNPHLNMNALQQIGNINPQSVAQFFSRLGAAPSTDPSLATAVAGHDPRKPYYAGGPR